MKRKLRLKPKKTLPCNKFRRIQRIWKHKRQIAERRGIAFMVFNEE